MKARLYFQLSFLLPIILPLLVWSSIGLESSFPIGISGMFILSLFIGGIPYLLFLAGFFFWVPGKDLKSIQRFTLLAPLLFIPVFVSCAFVVILLQSLSTGSPSQFSSVIVWFIAFCLCILFIGYFYVILTNAGYYLLRSVDFFIQEEVTDKCSDLE